MGSRLRGEAPLALHKRARGNDGEDGFPPSPKVPLALDKHARGGTTDMMDGDAAFLPVVLPSH